MEIKMGMPEHPQGNCQDWFTYPLSGAVYKRQAVGNPTLITNMTVIVFG